MKIQMMLKSVIVSGLVATMMVGPAFAQEGSVPKGFRTSIMYSSS